MFQNIVDAFKSKDVRKKILWTILLLLVYRVGCWLPLPGITFDFFDAGSNDFLSLLSTVTGGALAQGAFLALGVIPYISASIIMQLLTFGVPALERLSKQGEAGRKKIANITKIVTFVLALAQSISIIYAFGAENILNLNAFGENSSSFLVGLVVVVCLVAGAMFTMWLGERITDLGIGNGLSLLVFVGIVSSAGSTILANIANIGENIEYLWEILIFVALLVIIFFLITFVDLSQREIKVQYSKQIKGRKMYGGQSTNIPIKVNSFGVMPIIFATTFVMFPQYILQMFFPNSGALAWYSEWLGTGTIFYFIVASILIFFFSYFYGSMVFQPDEISRRLQQDGGFIPGIRAGRPTAEHIGKIQKRITFFGFQ